MVGELKAGLEGGRLSMRVPGIIFIVAFFIITLPEVFMVSQTLRLLPLYQSCQILSNKKAVFGGLIVKNG